MRVMASDLLLAAEWLRTYESSKAAVARMRNVADWLEREADRRFEAAEKRHK